MAYHQLSSEERYTIAALRWLGWNFSEVALYVGRHRSTISREVRRNSARLDGAYRAQKAIERTNGRRSRFSWIEFLVLRTPSLPPNGPGISGVEGRRRARWA